MATFEYFFAGLLTGIITLVAIADWRDERRDRAIRHLQGFIGKHLKLIEAFERKCTYPLDRKQWRELAREMRPWATANLSCLARPPGTCPFWCDCKKEPRP